MVIAPARIISQLRSSTGVPPPSATTAPGCRAFGRSSDSVVLNAASLRVAKRSAMGMPARSSTMRSRSWNGAPERSATSAPTTVFPEPMKPMRANVRGPREIKASRSATRRAVRVAGPRISWGKVFLASLDAARIDGRGCAGCASATSLRLYEDLIAESSRIGQVVEHLSPLSAGGVDLDASVTEHAPEHGLLRGAVLDAIDGDDFRRAAEHP